MSFEFEALKDDWYFLQNKIHEHGYEINEGPRSAAPYKTIVFIRVNLISSSDLVSYFSKRETLQSMLPLWIYIVENLNMIL